MSQKIDILKEYDDLRVADVRDAMDFLGYHFIGSLHHTIRPLFRTRAVGIALTAKYIPFDGVIPKLDPKAYLEWTHWYYHEVCSYPWIDEIVPGSMVVIDQSGVDAGLMGSENTLTCARKGAVGIVSNGGVRDTDEIILQKIPFWHSYISQSMVQGRLKYSSHGQTISVGGVTVNPGDVIVADGDGVICVPKDLAQDVAKLAHEEHERDKKRRREHYEALGKELDNTV